MANFAYTSDIPDTFEPALKAMCERLGCAPLELIAVAMAESGVKANARNPDGSASGLWQLMPATAKGLGWDPKDCDPDDGVPLKRFRELSATDQLPWFEKYFSPFGGRLTSRAACYVATFLPADLHLAQNRNAMLVQKGGRRGWAFSSNAVFDTNHDLVIHVFELEEAIQRNCKGPRWSEIFVRLGGQIDPKRLPDLRTTSGIQRALTALGYDPGPEDGIPGPRTRGALMAFQRDRHPFAGPIDGIPGPKTRAVLVAALQGTT
jgi:putative peptidoglycan binding protein/transglycosylase-like protein with SLT domain